MIRARACNTQCMASQHIPEVYYGLLLKRTRTRGVWARVSGHPRARARGRETRATRPVERAGSGERA